MRNVVEVLEFYGLLHRSAWTWVCSLSSWLLVLTMLSLGWCTSLGWKSDGLIRAHEIVLLLLGLVATLLAPIAWCILIAIQSCRITLGAHVIQVLLFLSGWLLTIPAGGWMESQGLPGWFLD